MSKKIILVITAVLLVACIATACSFSVTTANLQNVQTASDVNEDTFQPINVTSVFTTNTPVIYITAEVHNAPEGTVVTSDWYYMEDGVEYIDSAEVMTIDITTPVLFELSKPDLGWPAGEYSVDLLIDGELAQTVGFYVEATDVPYLTNIQTSKDVDMTSGTPINPTDTFSSQTPTIYIVADYYNAIPTETVFSTDWYYEGEYGLSLDYTAEYDSDIIYFYLEKGDEDWSLGDYSVDLTIDGVITDTVYFSVY